MLYDREGGDILQKIFISIIHVFLFSASITYFFTHTHQMRMSYKKTFPLFYGLFLFFYVLSLPFYDSYMIMNIYICLSLLIISHICFEETLKKRIMLLGIFCLIYIVEEMITTMIAFMIFPTIDYTQINYYIFRLCISNVQMFVYCLFVEKLMTKQVFQIKHFYFIPLGQSVILIILYYLGVVKCQTILEYIFIICTVLIVWCDYILYQSFLKIKQEKVSSIRHLQSQNYIHNQSALSQLEEQLFHHYEYLETLINQEDYQQIYDYMEKMKVFYSRKEDD